MCLHELFEAKARTQPNAIAMIDKEGSIHMTYGELDRRSHAVGCKLQSLGVRPDDFVGLLVDKSFDMIVSILGILRSGGAYVPMDPTYPEDRMRYIMEDAGMRVLVTEIVYVGVLSGLGVENVEVLLCVDDDYSMYDDMDLEREVCPSNVGYLIYTSGTTGQPKGVVCNHHGAVEIIIVSAVYSSSFTQTLKGFTEKSVFVTVLYSHVAPNRTACFLM